MNLWPLTSRRCTGHCCRAFGFHNPDVEKAVVDQDPIAIASFNGDDERKIIDMLIPLGRDIDNYPQSAKEAIPDLKRELETPMGERLCRYTCKHVKNDSCTNYKDRPNMCKEYPRREPYNFWGVCPHKGCTHRYSIFEALKMMCIMKRWTPMGVYYRLKYRYAKPKLRLRTLESLAKQTKENS